MKRERRLELTLTEEELVTLRRATKLEHMEFTGAWIRSVALRRAEEVIKEKGRP